MVLGDVEPAPLFRRADYAEGADRHQQACEGEPDDERAGQDRPGGRQRRAFHQPGGGFAVAEPDRLDGQHGGEAHPQRLQREQWYALGDVEDAGTKERGDVAEQAADLVLDVPGEVVIEPAAELTALMMVEKLSSVRIITAASLVTSVPVPIAIPMSAFFTAGASLTPLPVIAMIWPFFLRTSTRRTLCSALRET